MSKDNENLFRIDTRPFIVDSGKSIDLTNALNGSSKYPQEFADEYMLADKLKIFFSDSIYRNARVIHDLYLLAKLRNYDTSETGKIIKQRWEIDSLAELNVTIPNFVELEKAYNKLVISEYKIKYSSIIYDVFSFAYLFLHAIQNDYKGTLIWKKEHLSPNKSMINTINTTILLGVKGTICMESATYFHHMSTFPPNPIVLYSHDNNSLDSRYLILRNYLNSDKYLLKINDNLYITSKERTLCDLIIHESEERFLYESLESYLTEHENLDKLYEVADYFEIRDKLQFHIDNLDNWINEFYDH